MVSHPIAGGLGVLAVVLLVLGIAEFYSYVSSTLLDGWTPTSLGVLFVVALFAAVGVYAIEDRFDD